MSGMAIECDWIPGKCATFATCSTLLSLRMSRIIRSLAKTRPGTRMPPSWAMRQRYASICSMFKERLPPSHVDDDARAPASRVVGERELVVRDTLQLGDDFSVCMPLTDQSAAQRSLVQA